MWFLVGGPIIAAVGLAAWPALMSFRVRRWGQGALLLFASFLAPYVGLVVSVMALSDAMQRSGMPLGVIPVIALACWVVGIATPILLSVTLHLMGRFNPLSPMPKAQWRSPE